jgi:beta-N-acetylhexosaminidase
VALVSYGEGATEGVGSAFAAELRARGHEVTAARLTAASGAASYDSARAVLERSPYAVFAVAVRALAGRGTIGLHPAMAALVDSTAATRPTVLVSFGSPYIVMQTPRVGSYLVAWATNLLSERAAAHALTGAPITGRLPIRIPPGLPIGAGLDRPAAAFGGAPVAP